MNRYFKMPITGRFKDINKVSNGKPEFCSKHGNGANATLLQGVLKALDTYIMLNQNGGAVGKKGTVYVAEYHSSVPDTIHLVSWDSNPASGGAMMASIYNTALETVEQYSTKNQLKDGCALFLCLIPELLKDEEFQEYFEIYKNSHKSGKDGSDYEFKRAAFILCDNVYRRITNPAIPDHIEADLTGAILRISPMRIGDGSFMPDTVIEGAFEVFSKAASVSQTSSQMVKFEKNEFEGVYRFNERIFSKEEKDLVPVLKESYIIPKEIVKICQHAKATTDYGVPMRNFLLRGPAGTGKTEGAKAIAAGLGLPYMKYTCSSGTEIFDFIGQFIPDEKKQQEEKAIAGSSFEDKLSSLGLPSMEDIEFDPAFAFQMATGKIKEDAKIRDVVQVVIEKMLRSTSQSTSSQTDKEATASFRYQETDFIRALKNGYLIELQEPSTITMPGVLVGLNSLLERGGIITLPNGEQITRHPDAVVVVTTNMSYEGCNRINQSVVDRMDLVMEIPLPSKEILFERAMAITKETDAAMVSMMVEVVCDMASYCRAHGIDDGEVGMRSLISWILSTRVTKDPYESALDTIIAKATNSAEDQEELRSSFLDPKFKVKGV